MFLPESIFMRNNQSLLFWSPEPVTIPCCFWIISRCRMSPPPPRSGTQSWMKQSKVSGFASAVLLFLWASSCLWENLSRLTVFWLSVIKLIFCFIWLKFISTGITRGVDVTYKHFLFEWLTELEPHDIEAWQWTSVWRLVKLLGLGITFVSGEILPTLLALFSLRFPYLLICLPGNEIFTTSKAGIS